MPGLPIPGNIRGAGSWHYAGSGFQASRGERRPDFMRRAGTNPVGTLYQDPMDRLFTPLARSLGQLNDRVFLGVVARSLIWAVVCFAALHFAVLWAIHNLFALEGWMAWTADILGTIGASLISLWLFLPVAAAIGTLYAERIARAVERRHYPHLPPPAGAPLLDQALDGVRVGLRILGLIIVGLLLALVLPGVGLALGWVIGAYGIGRGLFVAVAMRRMSRLDAEALYRQNRGVVLAQGGAMALAAWFPLINLLIPVIGTAAMVHVLDAVMSRPPSLRR